MGYRSTFVTDDTTITLPEWFLTKWGDKIHVGAGNKLPISSKYEAKTYGIWQGLESDLQRVVRETGESWSRIHIVFMGEDGALSKSKIFSDRIEGDHITSV